MKRSLEAIAFLLLAASVGFLASCSSPNSPAAMQAANSGRMGVLAPPTLADTTPRHYESLHNVVAFGPGFYSGAQPDNNAAFAELRALGIKTIISVDGAIPDIETARSYGLKYVHLPIGYTGFDARRSLELTRATRDAAAIGPVYIHCHHGKHRSAGAAAAVAVSLGWMHNTQAVDRMKVSGTAPAYKGLYACAANAAPVSAADLDSIPFNFPEISRPGNVVAAMVDAEHAMDHLRLIEKSDWRIPNDHPDLVPAAEAGRLADLMRTQAQAASQRGMSEPYIKGLRASMDAASALEQLLASKQRPSRTELSASLKVLADSCSDCHVAHRDDTRSSW